MSVSAELAEARQERGLSLEAVSAKTDINIEQLSAIERMDVERLPSLAYISDVLRAYAAEVELDANDVAQRYLAELDVAAPSYAAPAASALAVPRSVDEADLDDFFSESDSDDEALPAARSAAIALNGDQFRGASQTDHDLTRTADHDRAPLEDHDLVSAPHPMFSGTAPSRTRYAPVALVAAIAILAGWLLSSNLDTITRRSTQTPGAQRDAQRDTPRAVNDASNANALEQVPPAVPAMSNPPPASPTARVTEPATNRSARTNAASPATLPEPLGARSIAPAPPATNPAADAQRSGETRIRETANNDVSGWWALTNRVESASADAFENLNLAFHLQLQQRGNRVTGTGEKWMENGRRIPPGGRTRISVEGTLTGQRLELNFTEHGTLRTSRGTFLMNVTDEGTLRGTFASDAANAQGTSLARRLESPPR